MVPLPSVRPSLLTLLLLAGCDWGTTDPVSLAIQFAPDHTLNADGTCTVQWVAAASGIGTAQWERVAVVRDGSVVEEYVGAETAQFWGLSTISAGQAQQSTPFTAPDGGDGTSVEVDYRITTRRSTSLPSSCDDA